MNKLINKLNKALETLIDHTDNVLRDTDGATDYIIYEVPIECRTDIATYFYDRGNFKDLASTTCDHCHKRFFLINHAKENPKDVCHCIYERTINPYHGGFNYTNKTADLYDYMFNRKSTRYWPQQQNPLTAEDSDTKWINKHGNKVTISRDFGTNVPVERNLTLGINHLQEEYDSRNKNPNIMRHVDQDYHYPEVPTKPKTK